MWRWLIWLLVFWWIARLVGRLLAPRPTRRPDPPPTPAGGGDLSRLTEQEISDADFEEIPPPR